MAAAGCCWLLLAAAGCCRLLLAAAGCCWLLLAAAGAGPLGDKNERAATNGDERSAGTVSGLLAPLLIFRLSGLICSHLAYLDISGDFYKF
jgi:hypothetical protein